MKVGKDVNDFHLGTEVIGLLPMNKGGGCSDFVTTNHSNLGKFNIEDR
jgi:hypothetical protein